MMDKFKDDAIPTVATFKLTDKILDHFKLGLKRTCGSIDVEVSEEMKCKMIIYLYTVDCGYAEFNSPVNNDLDLHIIDNHLEEIKEYLFK